MRPIAVNQRALRGAKEELDSAREELRAALGEIDHPADDFPWRDLMVEGVRSLVQDAEQVATRCRNIASAIDESIIDFDELDIMVGEAAAVAIKLDQVKP
ncbi:hypothetical protein HN031_05470 [Nocardioides sp. zg-1308]|jgi:hypothetical protein|uniref:Uncharacterized protein n=1 Tax=Nocardioides renjunii TaxID=3095075 RepID=A0ABU5K841_9ACTN|nr:MULTISPECIES: hypothetical protein [unclassified Nocardioides]MDZ5661013.1 hypothetical protein [Nocardioides sp. S-58]NPD04131.1 hypothetical protein [Nocardioides sp. zg-1308]WQQ22017.1 hypothetical protein SHK17_19265 [Nocardioides sp. S-34]